MWFVDRLQSDESMDGSDQDKSERLGVEGFRIMTKGTYSLWLLLYY
jgi:hypothetical protein